MCADSMLQTTLYLTWMRPLVKHLIKVIVIFYGYFSIVIICDGIYESFQLSDVVKDYVYLAGTLT